MVFGKPWKMLENTETSDLQQLKQEGIIQYQNQTIIQQNAFPKNQLALEMKKKIRHT